MQNTLSTGHNSLSPSPETAMAQPRAVTALASAAVAGTGEVSSLLEENETSTATREEIVQNLSSAHRSLIGLTSDTKYIASCIDKGIDPYEDVGTVTYWAHLHNYTATKIAELRRSNGDNLKMRCLEILAATPEYVLNRSALNQGGLEDRQAKRRAKEVTSNFNMLIRQLAVGFPELRASDLSRALVNVANVSIEDSDVKRGASRAINYAIRGAQHELAFGQLLETSRYEYRVSTTDEDLSGADYFVKVEGKWLKVDVKASLGEIEARGSEGAYSAHGRSVVMYSLVTDAELADRFCIDQVDAANKGRVAATMLDKVAQNAA